MPRGRHTAIRGQGPRAAAYNYGVPDEPMTLFFNAALGRGLLLLNHLLMSEPAACARLLPHAGKCLYVTWQVAPGPWPRPRDLAVLVTPAGLFERAPQTGEPAADLRVGIELPAPHLLALRWLGGQRPSVTIDGDASLATDIGWLADNLRWDMEHDLARLVGDAVAYWLAGVARAVREALRPPAARVAGWAAAGDAGPAAAQ